MIKTPVVVNAAHIVKHGLALLDADGSMILDGGIAPSARQIFQYRQIARALNSEATLRGLLKECGELLERAGQAGYGEAAEKWDDDVQIMRFSIGAALKGM